MDLMKELLEDDYMQYQMKKKHGANPLTRDTMGSNKPTQAPQRPMQAPQQADPNVAQNDVPGDMQGAMQGDMQGGGGDTQAANQAAKQAVKLLRQSAQALAPAKFEGDTSKAMEYLLGRIQDYFANKQI